MVLNCSKRSTAESFSYTWEFAVCGLVGLLGGMLGAGFNWLHKVRPAAAGC